MEQPDRTEREFMYLIDRAEREKDPKLAEKLRIGLARYQRTRKK
jgi:hypothetical protein